MGDLIHPIDVLAVKPFLNCDVRHRSSRRGPVPMLLAGRKPDDIAGADLLHRTAFPLHPATARADDERLSKRMGVPCSARARFERYTCAGNERRIGRLKQRIDAHISREPIG